MGAGSSSPPAKPSTVRAVRNALRIRYSFRRVIRQMTAWLASSSRLILLSLLVQREGARQLQIVDNLSYSLGAHQFSRAPITVGFHR